MNSCSPAQHLAKPCALPAHCYNGCYFVPTVATEKGSVPHKRDELPRAAGHAELSIAIYRLYVLSVQAVQSPTVRVVVWEGAAKHGACVCVGFTYSNLYEKRQW